MNTIEEFSKDGFIVVRNFLKDHKELYKYTIKMKPKGDFGTQVPNTPEFYNDKRIVAQQNKYMKKIEKLTGLELYKTYTFNRVYKKGDILKIHSDRPACEISITINLGGKPWAIWIVDYNEKPYKVHLSPGDSIIYRGCDLKHWREKNLHDDYSQIFFHFVDQVGPNAWAKDDIKR